VEPATSVLHKPAPKAKAKLGKEVAESVAGDVISRARKSLKKTQGNLVTELNELKKATARPKKIPAAAAEAPGDSALTSHARHTAKEVARNEVRRVSATASSLLTPKENLKKLPVEEEDDEAVADVGDQDDIEAEFTEEEIAAMEKQQSIPKVNEDVDPQRLLQFLREAGAENPVLVDVKGKCNWTDHFLVASAASSRALERISEDFIERMERVYPDAAYTVDPGAEWFALDLGSAVVSLMLPAIRRRYDLEKLWTERGPLDAQMDMEQDEAYQDAHEAPDEEDEEQEEPEAEFHELPAPRPPARPVPLKPSQAPKLASNKLEARRKKTAHVKSG
jgi:ribosome-associated protein